MAAHSFHQPSWQNDVCPRWCTVEHAELDLPDDRVHDSVGTYLPVVLGVDASGQSKTVDLLVMMSRRCGTVDDWVFIGETDRDGQHLQLSRESATRIVSSLAHLLVQ